MRRSPLLACTLTFLSAFLPASGAYAQIYPAQTVRIVKPDRNDPV
jgi:hypothetical protein